MCIPTGLSQPFSTTSHRTTHVTSRPMLSPALSGVLPHCHGGVWLPQGHRAAQSGIHLHLPGKNFLMVSDVLVSNSGARSQCCSYGVLLFPPLLPTGCPDLWRCNPLPLFMTRPAWARQHAITHLDAAVLVAPTPMPLHPAFLPHVDPPLAPMAMRCLQEVVINFHKAPKRWWEACTSQKGKENLYK